MHFSASLLCGTFAAALATTALAGAPEPVKPVDTRLYSGRWYEIARTANQRQSDCHAATSDFSAGARGTFSVVQSCHKGTSGQTTAYKARGTIVPDSGNTKIKLGFFGGLINQEYWIEDHADDNSWAIMATPGGHYVWLLSRRPALDARARAAALKRVHDLGFDSAKLIYNDGVNR
jgi:apolipoprotein D and lipocalin family protein